MVTYHSDLSRIQADDLQGFFSGWPSPPSPETHHRLLAGSTHFIVAVPEGESRVIGYVSAISDGVLSAYISQLEVLPEHRGHGIGSTLVRSLLERLHDLYMVDLVCDPDVQPFYEAAGMTRWSAMILRNYEALIDSRASR
ncbi:MAG: GNAT family N-acetyltransferase [Planctomycetota bacterium]|jgi:ribosomal protein S18 acetylase RimI-like enzyme